MTPLNVFEFLIVLGYLGFSGLTIYFALIADYNPKDLDERNNPRMDTIGKFLYYHGKVWMFTIPFLAMAIAIKYAIKSF